MTEVKRQRSINNAAAGQPERNFDYRLSLDGAIEIIRSIATTPERVTVLSYLLKHVLRNKTLINVFERIKDELPEPALRVDSHEIIDEVEKELEKLLEPYKVITVDTLGLLELIKSVECVKTDRGALYRLTIDTPLGPVVYTVKSSQLYAKRKGKVKPRLPKELVAELVTHRIFVNFDDPDVFVETLARAPCDSQDREFILKLKKIFQEVFETDCKNLMERKSDVQTGGGDAAQGDAPEEVEEVGGEDEGLTKEYPEIVIVDGEVHILKSHMAKYFVKYNIATKGAKSFVKVATELGLLRREHTSHMHRGKSSAYYVFDKAALDGFLGVDTANLCREKEPLLLDLEP